MKVKLAQALFIVYIILVSLITKKFQLLTLVLFALIFLIFNLFIKRISNLENLAYIAAAFAPFPNLLYIFLIHLPFAVFGFLLEKRNFIKSYITGFSVSLLPTILVYTAANYFSLKLNFFIILMFFYLPAILAIIVIIKKKRDFDFVSVNFQEYLIILTVLLATVFVGIIIVNNYSLFISNGTYIYSKYELIVKSINFDGMFPIYDPATSQGESPFLFESPLVFSHLAFMNILLPFVDTITFYNAFSLFILFLSTLSLCALIISILNKFFEDDKNRILNTSIVIIGSLLIGLHFYFVQLLESFKQFFAFPINYLIFCIILDRPKKFQEILLVLYMIALTFIIHTPHGVGIVLISLSMLVLIIINLYFSKEIGGIKNWMLNNKFRAIAALVILSLMPAFYILPTFIFSDSLEDQEGINFNNFGKASMSYILEFPKHHSLLSLEYPDINRNDDKKFGPLISVLGIFSLAILLILFYRSKSLSDFRLFSGAYALHFLISAIIINLPMIGSLEYGYRTVSTYFLILLVISICAFILLIRNRYAKLFLAAVILIGLIHMLPLAKKNIEKIHQEEFISGKSFVNEINFVKSLPKDGRIITYGLFANAVDPGMASFTRKYFSRFHLTEYARSRSIYAKIHSEHSFGQTDTLFAMSGRELSNYLRLGGYKYILLYGAHPAGNFVANGLYPNFSYPIYQNQAIVMLVVNGTSYAEKISLIKNVESGIYKKPDGYKYVTLSGHYKFDRNVPYSSNAAEPEPLNFKILSPTSIEIYGSFKDNEWVTFKETYFSRWKAYMSGKEVPVLASNHNLLLVRTVKGDAIKLEYNILPVEKIFGMISLASALIILLAFIFLL